MIISYISHLRYEIPACVRSTTLIKAAQYDARVLGQGMLLYENSTQRPSRLDVFLLGSMREVSRMRGAFAALCALAVVGATELWEYDAFGVIINHTRRCQ